MSNKSIRWAFNFGSWKPTQEEILLASSCIQPEEKERLAKFVFKKDFKASLIGRLMIRKFLTLATNLSYDEINIVRDDRGKPIYNSTNSDNIDFNVSHQGQFTVLAGEIGGTKLGVDVMQIGYSGGKNLSEFFRIMNRQFSTNEWATIKNSGNEHNQISTFCRNWSLKESYVKAIGVGITINLQDIDFKINTSFLNVDNNTLDTELFVSGKKEPWLFEETMLDNNHCVATALFNSNGFHTYKPVKFVHLTFDELMKGALPLLNKDIDYCNKFFKKDD